MKTKLIVVLSALINCCTNAQPWGEIEHTHSGTILSDGNVCYVNGNPGFTMAGYVPVVSAGNPNIYIDRTDAGGTYTTGNTFMFTEAYTYSYTPSGCSGTLTQGLDCAGVSLIETAGTATTANYVMTGAFDQGVFFSALSSAGVPLANAFCRFPTGTITVSQPLIAESYTAGTYYVCGSYSTTANLGFMYVLLVNSSGTVLNSKKYQLFNNVSLVPKDMVTSPYAGELVIAGKADVVNANLGFKQKGFIIRLDGNTLANISCRLYGQHPDAGNNNVEYFNAIDTANGGFVLGGYCDSLAALNAETWFAKLDQSCINYQWSWLIQPNSGTTAEPVAITQRYSNYYSDYEYYSACTSSLGAVVFKLDAGGIPFTSTVATDVWDEFVYQVTGNPLVPAAISYIDNNAGVPDQGIHVYGTRTGRHYLVEATFNGLETCTSVVTYSLPPYNQGPTRTGTVAVTVTSGPSVCAGFSLVNASQTPTETVNCSTLSVPAGGSMNKNTITEIKSSFAISDFVLFPNPTNGNVYIKTDDSDLSIKLRDMYGRDIAMTESNLKTITKQNITELYLEDLYLKAGIYFIEIKSGHKRSVHKLNYQKE